jgi:hypothetical protein
MPSFTEVLRFPYVLVSTERYLCRVQRFIFGEGDRYATVVDAAGARHVIRLRWSSHDGGAPFRQRPWQPRLLILSISDFGRSVSRST